MTDQEIAQACREGNREVQRQLFDAHARLMMSVCLRYADSRQEAEDILQEGFIKVFERMHQYENRGPLGGWIRTLMVNTALNHIRKHKRWNHSMDIEAANHLDSDETDALSEMSANELMQLVNKMPKGYKTVFNLYAVEGFTHSEIGDQLGISENTSKTQFMKARGWMKKELELLNKTVGQ